MGSYNEVKWAPIIIFIVSLLVNSDDVHQPSSASSSAAAASASLLAATSFSNILRGTKGHLNNIVDSISQVS